MLNNGDQVLYIDGLTITDATGVTITNVGINWTVANTHNDGKKTVNLYWSEKIIGSFS